jgi:hypothetical protein
MKKFAAIMAGAALMMGMAASAHADTMNLSLTVLDSAPPTSTVTYNALPSNTGAITIANVGTVNNVNFGAVSGNEYTSIPNDFTVATTEFVVQNLTKSTKTITLDLSGSLSNLPILGLSPNAIVTQDLTFLTASVAPITADFQINGSSAFGGAQGFGISYGLSTIDSLSTYDEIISVTLAGQSKIGIYDSVSVDPVPEPGTMMLLGVGMLGLAIYGKRRMNKEA